MTDDPCNCLVCQCNAILEAEVMAAMPELIAEAQVAMKIMGTLNDGSKFELNDPWVTDQFWIIASMRDPSGDSHD